jgi:hypothetical protein
VRQRAQPGSGTVGWLAAATGVVAVVAILVFGLRPEGPLVGPGASSPPSVRPTARPSNADVRLVGTKWTVELRTTDPGVSDPAMVGGWTLRLGEGSVVEVTPPGDFPRPSGAMLVSGAYAITDEGFVTNLFTRGFGSSCAGPGEYQAVLDDGRLVFTGRDTCQVRHTVLATRPWTSPVPAGS